MARDASVRLIMRVTHTDFDSFTIVSNQKVSVTNSFNNLQICG